MQKNVFAKDFLKVFSQISFDADHNIVSLTVKSDNKEQQEKADIMSSKTDKIGAFDKKEREEQRKQDNGPDKNQKSEKIIKDEDKMEKMNAEKNNKANEKADKVDKPEKTNKDEKREEKGGKGPAKSPTGNGSKTLPSPDSKSKVGLPHSLTHSLTHCCPHTFPAYRHSGRVSSEYRVSPITQRSQL